MPRLLPAIHFVAMTGYISLSSVAAEPVQMSWPDRYGPTYSGLAAPEESVDLPVQWDERSGENIEWKIALPGFGHSTPVIAAGKIWLTYATEDGTQQSILCLDEQTGEPLHDQLLFSNSNPEPLHNKVNTYASPSCVLEEDAVYVHFGSYGTARIRPDTYEVVWQRTDIPCRHFRGPGSSPILFENLLILTYDGIDQQFVTALDKATGATVWRTDRSTNYDDLDQDGQPRGEGDYRKAYGTPGLKVVNGRTQLLSVGSRAAFGYDALTGEEIWTITHDDFNASARPINYKEYALINTGSGSSNLVCLRLDDTTLGNVDKSHVKWNRPKQNSDLSSPILANGLVFMILGNGVTVCVDPETGDEVWKARIGGTYVASPVSANNLVYFTSEEGVTTVVRASDRFEEVASNHLEEGMRSSPAIANGALFLRTFGHLYKISQKKQ
ncbi:PQQ-binding-like beta-propeller repeat protein [Planctomicrobium sp. SH668]|uniref:outer membrane protein assembly factor BamB family protein n=1 Tax=Planctomicrobium sp. SH668 TaxID=3448126 RepID=UPI003F5AFB8A